MSQAPAKRTLSGPKSNFNARDAVPAPAHSSRMGGVIGKLSKRWDRTCHSLSLTQGGALPKKFGPMVAPPGPGWPNSTASEVDAGGSAEDADPG